LALAEDLAASQAAFQSANGHFSLPLTLTLSAVVSMQRTRSPRMTKRKGWSRMPFNLSPSLSFLRSLLSLLKVSCSAGVRSGRIWMVLNWVFKARSLAMDSRWLRDSIESSSTMRSAGVVAGVVSGEVAGAVAGVVTSFVVVLADRIRPMTLKALLNFRKPSTCSTFSTSISCPSVP